MAFLISVSERD